MCLKGEIEKEWAGYMPVIDEEKEKAPKIPSHSAHLSDKINVA